MVLNFQNRLLRNQKYREIQKQLVIKHKICGLITHVSCAECLPPETAANYGCYILGLSRYPNITAVFVCIKTAQNQQ
jgi:hypothetical protein